MHALISRRMTIGLALLVVLAFSLTLPGMTGLAARATPARAPITLSKVTGPPTTKVTVNGTGFGSSETVNATFDTTTTVGTTTTSSMGSFSFGITIPSTALPGSHSIQASGQSSGLTASRIFLVNTNWSQFGYDQAHGRTNPYENVLLGTNVSRITLDWRYPTGSAIGSSPAVANGVVYIGSDDGKMYALDAMTGARLWSYPTGGFINSSPAVARGVVYIGSSDRKVYALDARTGIKLWSYPTRDDIFSSPAVAQGVVYIGSYDHKVYALDAKTGARLWSYPTGSNIFSSPAVANGVLYIGSANDNVYAFHLPGTQP
jgi:outer membrane protein assembly factor BamB